MTKGQNGKRLSDFSPFLSSDLVITVKESESLE